jgi:hypothetical protein
LIFVKAGQKGSKQVEVIKEEQGQPVDGIGGCISQEIFDQGTAIFTEVNGMYTRHR